MASEYFVSAAQRHECSTYKLRKTLKRHAVHKDGERRNYGDSNLLFPPSMIETDLNEDSVAMILSCDCNICAHIDSEPHTVEDLNKEIRGEHGTRLLLAILIWMGTGFAMRSLYFNGLGRDNNFDLAETFANNRDLKATLFRHLSSLTILGSTSPDVDQLFDIFCTRFAEVKQLFKPPYFKEEEIFKNVSPNSNPPFLHETEPRGRHSSYARLYKFKIHPEFCSPTLKNMELVRKELTMADIHADRERNVLEFLRKKRHPNLVHLHFAYCHKGISNLVFTYFPMDLRLVLGGLNQPANPIKAQNTPKLEGSILDHWLWVNLKGVVEALPLIHDPSSSTIGAHFDLKPANILVDDSGNLVVTDFGLTRIKEISTHGNTSLTNPGGDFNYRPPPTPARWNRKYDVWCLACIMIKIIIFVKDGSDALSRFLEDLETEDNVETRSQTFWKQGQGRYTLKIRSNSLLEELNDPRDHYLKGVGKVLNRMLSIETHERPTMPEVHNALFGQNPDPTLPIQRNPLEKMQVFVHSNKPELHTSCYLDWCDDDDGKVSLRMYYTKNNDKDRNLRSSEEFVPISIYKQPDAIGGSNKMSCRFRGLHQHCDFQFSQPKDFYNFQAATTRQAVLTRSHVKISGCSLTFKRAQWHVHSDTLYFSSSGQIQIWREIGDIEYRRKFVDGVIPVMTESVIPKGMSHTQPSTKKGQDFQPESTSSDTYEWRSLKGLWTLEDKLDEDPRRLAIFLPKKLCRYLTVPLSQGKAVLSKMPQKPNSITFETGKNQSYFPVGLFGDFGKHSFPTSRSSSLDTHLPGIPLDAFVVENREKSHITSLEVSFPTPDDWKNFLNVYHQVFPNQKHQ